MSQHFIDLDSDGLLRPPSRLLVPPDATPRARSQKIIRLNRRDEVLDCWVCFDVLGEFVGRLQEADALEVSSGRDGEVDEAEAEGRVDHGSRWVNERRESSTDEGELG